MCRNLDWWGLLSSRSSRTETERHTSMSNDDAGIADARLAAALEHVLADVLGERQGLDLDRELLAAVIDLSLEPGQIRAALDLEGVEVVVDERLEEARGQHLLQQRTEAGNRPGGDETLTREPSSRHCSAGESGRRRL